MTSDSLLSDAGWMFLGAWAIVVVFVGFIAFGGELLRPRVPHIAPSTPTNTRKTH